ncbi:MAG: 4Fe-4S cluster-binding domain-containing protein [Clostridia bacterium]|nr:4Fe-4S cluster-binding domain-containing protein [Clostridia bacterium]
MPYICRDCPRACGALRGETGSGFCKMGEAPVIARAALHFDEEPIISGSRGSGAIFFSGCTLKCKFCQNYKVSHHGYGKRITVHRLKEIYWELIEQGAHNINLVTPSHFATAIIESLNEPLPVPVVWNCSGYESIDTLKRLEGKVQIYLPDLKYVSSTLSSHCSAAPDYFDTATKAIEEMLRQTGPVELDDNDMIKRGVMIRHLILPNCADDSIRVLDWIAERAPDAWVSLMAQYLPFGEAKKIKSLNRQITQEEYDRVFERMVELGLENGFVQELSSSDEKYIPAFDLSGV